MAHRPHIYELDLDKNAANHAPLTPLTFLAWTAEVYPQHLAVVHGSRRLTWGDVYARSRRLASALAARGVGVGDTVAVMDDGLVVHAGAMKELVENEGLQQRLLGLSLGAHQ